jgi:hypothetical protein
MGNYYKSCEKHFSLNRFKKVRDVCGSNNEIDNNIQLTLRYFIYVTLSFLIILFAHCVRTSLYCYLTLVRIYFQTDVTFTHLVLFKMQLAQMSFLALIVVLAQIQVSIRTLDAPPRT